MNEDRKKPGVAFWATVVLVVVVVLVGYPLSIGPAFWATGENEAAFMAVAWAYLPLCWTVSMSPEVVKEAFNRYLGLWTDETVRIE